MAEIEIELNGTNGERVKRVLVCYFGNCIGFRKSGGKTLIVTSTQKPVIDDLIAITGLTVVGEQ